MAPIVVAGAGIGGLSAALALAQLALAQKGFEVHIYILDSRTRVAISGRYSSICSSCACGSCAIGRQAEGGVRVP
jgi:2-polyprenyl-6-methoxyphenol hydroxylase-like FAD-dependent oxidoreductase